MAREAYAERHGDDIYPSADGLIVEQTPYGTDMRRVCWVHQWASHVLPAADEPLLSACPLCEAERDMEPGKRRYRQLHQRFVTNARD